MNRLKILLITTALITGSSALASAEEHHENGWGYQTRYNEHDRNGDRDDHYRNKVFYRNSYGYGYGDRDRDDRYFHRRKDRDDFRFGWGRDRDHDGDRR